MITVGSVSYTNARPLVHALAGKVNVELAVPSALPEMLDSGEAQAVMVSSFDALSVPGRTFAEGCCIGSDGDADSVRLFSRVPFGEIRTLSLDQSSLTSNHLARILLAERYGVRPQCEPARPDLGAMLQAHDACILIGDKGMMADGDGLHVMDLGREWTEFTGLPFVWALWVGREDLTPELARILLEARIWGETHIEEVIPDAVQRSGWPEATVRRYFTSTMNYDLTERHLEGLELFRTLLQKHGFVGDAPFPRMIHASPVAVG